MASKKSLFLIIPSMIVARGLEAIVSEAGEFRVEGILSDLSRTGESRLLNVDADAVIIDPSVFDSGSRPGGRNLLSSLTPAPVVAIETVLSSEEDLKQYDAVINLFDPPSAIIRKVRSAIESRQESPRTEGEELSAREKEILICVAKGMLNKEIADLYNISIYTVITHRKNITRKTGIKTVAGLTVYALLNNLIDMNSVE